ncbi:hypothetical protein JFT81_16285 [Pseudomonas sp. TH43]|nr:hypothetical protein [Pseudomonas sp. TH43]MBK5376190.1 hypothetical protein [Pseudomonas sp. TH43]
MRSVVGCSVVLALATLAGCANWGGADKGPVVVDYYAGTTDLSGYPGMGIGAGNVLYGNAGAAEGYRYQPLEVRQCNAQKSACALGIVNLVSQIQILSVGDTVAKLRVDLNYQVGAEGRREWPENTYVEKLSVPEIINDKGTVSRTAEVPYGEVRHIELPYGVSLTLCVSPPGVSNMNTRPCAGQLKVKDTTGVPVF